MTLRYALLTLLTEGEGHGYQLLKRFKERVGSFGSHLLEDQPGTALLTALVAGFITGGGLASPIGTRVTSATVRATLGNVATLVALDLLRRALDVEGASDGGGESAAPK